MTMPEYLQSEQAREDVRAMMAEAPLRSLNGRPKTEGSASRIPLPKTLFSYQRLPRWNRLKVSRKDAYELMGFEDLVSAYYRPDGDRYIVTDLGEGVRALRMRTGVGFVDLLQKCRRSKEANHFYGLFGQIHDATIGAGNWERGLAIGALLDVGTYADESNLPDAICRVMLASLRAAEVTP